MCVRACVCVCVCVIVHVRLKILCKTFLLMTLSKTEDLGRCFCVLFFLLRLYFWVCIFVLFPAPHLLGSASLTLPTKCSWQTVINPLIGSSVPKAPLWPHNSKALGTSWHHDVHKKPEPLLHMRFLWKTLGIVVSWTTWLHTYNNLYKNGLEVKVSYLYNLT